MYVSPISSRFCVGRLTPAMRAIGGSQPCLCLCRGLVQMTMVRPCRLITRHRSHMGLTDGRTFISDPCLRLSAPLHGKHARVRPPRAGDHRSKLGSSFRVRILGPCSVTATVCSKWAESELS